MELIDLGLEQKEVRIPRLVESNGKWKAKFPKYSYSSGSEIVKLTYHTLTIYGNSLRTFQICKTIFFECIMYFTWEFMTLKPKYYNYVCFDYISRL